MSLRHYRDTGQGFGGYTGGIGDAKKSVGGSLGGSRPSSTRSNEGDGGRVTRVIIKARNGSHRKLTLEDCWSRSAGLRTDHTERGVNW